MNAFGFIYLTTNLINGKQYIGQARYSTPYWKSYLGSGKAMKAAIKKYGRESFDRQVIFEAFTEDDLTWAEIYLIAEHEAVASDRFYNITPGGRSSLGFSGKMHSKEHKEKMSELLKGHPVTDKIRQTTAETGKLHFKKNFQSIISCPKCNKTGPVGVMKQWHFENCGNAKQLQCMHCKFISTSHSCMKRWHFDNCKLNPALDKKTC